MSGGSVELIFGGEKHAFNVRTLGAWRQLQKSTGYGPFVLANRLLAKESFVDEFREILRVGLIFGEKLPEAEASSLMEAYFDTVPLAFTAPLAIEVITAALFEQDDLKKV